MSIINLAVVIIVSLIEFNFSKTSYLMILYCTVHTAIENTVGYKLSEYMNDYSLAIKQLEIQSKRDFLTGLNNVREFYASFNKIIEMALEKE